MSGRGGKKGGPKLKKKMNSHKGQSRRFGDPPPEEWDQNRPKQTKNEGENDEDEEDEENEDEEDEFEKKEESGDESGTGVGEVGASSTGVKTTKTEGAAPLTRREREELEKQASKAAYQKLHREGKTEEAKRDLARLAVIRKEREDAAKKREEEKKAKDDARKSGKLTINK